MIISVRLDRSLVIDAILSLHLMTLAPLVRVEFLDGERDGHVEVTPPAAILELAFAAAEGALHGLEDGGHEAVALAAPSVVLMRPLVEEGLVDVLGDLVDEQLPHVGLHGRRESD